MMLSKKDIMIVATVEKHTNLYHLFMRVKAFWFFKRWVPITYQEAENGDEIPVEFESMAEAEAFIENITK